MMSYGIGAVDGGTRIGQKDDTTHGAPEFFPRADQ